MNKRYKKEAQYWEKAAWDLLYLTRCGINANVPEEERVAEMDLNKVYALSRRQSLESITCLALERLAKAGKKVWNPDSEPIYRKWEETKNKVIRKTLLMNAAREQLFLYMEQEKIWHLPLKGAVLSSLYPQFGMRQMADNDILFDGVHRQKVRDWFDAQGYTAESFGESNHDVYHREPIYNFEMHTDLFHADSYPQFFRYYQSLKDRLELIAGKAFEYKMSDEDFYIYLLVHEYKHDSNGGTGLRSLLDLYVYNKIKDNLNDQYIKEELKKLGLSEYEEELRKLSLKVFSPEYDANDIADKEQSILQKRLYGRTYGTIQNIWRKQVGKITTDGDRISAAVKIKYIWKRVFPDKYHMEKWCELHAPFFQKHRCLMPAARVWRIIRLKREQRKLVKQEFDTVRKMER